MKRRRGAARIGGLNFYPLLLASYFLLLFCLPNIAFAQTAPFLDYNSHTFADCGNADGVVDPGEAIDLNIIVQNTGDADAFSVSGVLSTVTPGVTVFVNNVSFPDISIGLTGASLTPFRFMVDPSVPCTTLIDFTLSLSYTDAALNPFSNAMSFQVQVGQGLPPLFSEDFEACTVPPAGWTEIESGTTTLGWEPQGPDCPPGCFSSYTLPTNFAVNNSDSNCYSFTLTNDTELITPPIDASAAANVTLTFDHHFRGYVSPGSDGAETATVKARSANTDGAWVTLIQWDETQPNKGTIVLDATAECAEASDCQFNWHYGVAQYDLFWAFDNVVVQELVCNPAACGGCSAVSDILPDAPAVCAGGCAALDANPSGGTPPYSYSWSTGATERVITVSPAATTAYSVTVTDFKGCTALSNETVTVVGCPTWARTYGGALDDGANSVQQTTDGGYVVAGFTESFGASGRDFWVLKLDANGDLGPPGTWQKIYGGAGSDEAYSIQQTRDDGYVVAGITESFGAGGKDFWVLKLDADGNVGPAFPGTWQKTFGVTNDDRAWSVQQTTDGGFVVAGDRGASTEEQLLVLKLDSVGNVQWDKLYWNFLIGFGWTRSIQQTTDGGYVVAGHFCVGSPCGFLVLKLDASGNVVWDKLYDNNSNTTANSIQQTTDGGFIVAGDGSWVLKLNAFGNIEWEKTFGVGVAYSVQQTSDGGYIMAAGIVIKLDASGNVEWGKNYGVTSIRQTTDGGYIAAGGINDFRVVKLDANGNIDPSCTTDTAVVGTDTSASVPSVAIMDDSPFTLTAASTGVTGADSSAVITEPCAGSSGCPPLSCAASVDAAAVCLGAAQAFVGNLPSCSVAPIIYEWDFDYDGAFTKMDSGTTVSYTYPLAGSYTAAFRVTDSCTDPEPQTCLSTIPITVAVPDVAYDATTALVQACGDGDLFVEPGEEWQVTVQLVNNAACTVNNVKADLTVNPGSAVAAAVCSNPGFYGSILPLGTAQYTYSFVVDSLAVCVNDVTFDVTGIVSDEGAYPDEIAAFGVTVGQVTLTAVQATDPLMVKNDTLSSDFAPVIPLATPVASAELSYTLTHEGGAADVLDCTKVELVDPLSGVTLIKDTGVPDPPKPVDVTGSYIGIGTYQLQLTEAGKGCGSGSATISSGTLSVTSAAECDVSGCVCPLSLPSEPSPVGSPDPLLIPTTAANQIIVENVLDETHYVVYEEAIGAWYGIPTRTCLDTWNDLGSTVELGYSIVGPGDRWVVVSAANAAGESSCGMDSAGAERNEAPGWPAMGPCP